jgi:hypothetical protein
MIRPRNETELPKEAFSRLIIESLWPGASFNVTTETDLSGIDGFIDGRTLQHKYDKTIPRYNRLWDEYYGKDKGHPEDEWHETKRVAAVYVFTTGGDWFHRNINGAWAVRVLLSDLRAAERRLRMVTNTNQTSRGYFLPLGNLKGADIQYVAFDATRYDYHIRTPLIDWPLDEYIKEVRAIASGGEPWYQHYCAERGEVFTKKVVNGR